MAGYDWRDDAYCVTSGVDPIYWTGEDRTMQHLAAHLCNAHCPVLAECKADADEYAYRGVVAAGTIWSDDRGSAIKHQGRRLFVCPICLKSTRGRKDESART